MRSWKIKRNYFELKSGWAFCNKDGHRMDGRKEVRTSWISVLGEVSLCLWVPAAVHNHTRRVGYQRAGAAYSRYHNDGKRCDRATPLTLRAKEKSLTREHMNRCMAIWRNAAGLHKHVFFDRLPCNLAPLGFPSLWPIQASTSVSKENPIRNICDYLLMTT
ncbi:uncharacterized protein B0T23DRAFT_400523 [Neurospora hispaniola]|uniref:Uncharacterized protein n=1 Tax=Neurospora hispaniola TaxID=588809 RepID=A0AAJ0IEJ1_9PEZI|nr:hypothetical protein B0T23DRAFT_400523 [Neurospora hispaniola]